MDHNVSTRTKDIDKVDTNSRLQMDTLSKNCRQFGVLLYDFEHKDQGIVHVIGPEQGLTLPGMTIVCGDSHTADDGHARQGQALLQEAWQLGNLPCCCVGK